MTQLEKENFMLNSIYHNITKRPEKQGLLLRPRLDDLLSKAAESHFTMVTAGAGYGKTQAVSMFLNSEQHVAWLQLSKLDNLQTRFWEAFVYAVSLGNKDAAVKLERLRYPNSLVKFNKFLHILAEEVCADKKYFLVFDDFHLLNNDSILNFVKNLISANLGNLYIIIISRTNLSFSPTNDMESHITAEDLRFTYNETADYLKRQDIRLTETERLNIYNYTEGWPLAICLMALSIKKGVKTFHDPISDARSMIFQMIDNEIFSGYSTETRKFLIKLSLSENIPMEIMKEFSKENYKLIDEIEKTNMFIRYDMITKTHRFHHLFLEFLSKKLFYLTNEEIKETHFKFAGLYHTYGFELDAIEHYQKSGHSEEIWKIISHYDIQMPAEVSGLFLKQIEAFPNELTVKYPLIPVVHARLLLNIGKIEECVIELEVIINTYKELPPTAGNRAVLGEAYLGMGRISLASFDYKFIDYYKTADEYLPHGSTLVDNRFSLSNGGYMIIIKETDPGELDKFVNAAVEAFPHAARAMNGAAYGAEYLTKAEAAYFRGHMKEAESNAFRAIHRAEHKQQYDTVCAAYFVLIRIYLISGNKQKSSFYIEQLVKKLEKADARYTKNCLFSLDILKGWYYSHLGCLNKVPEWILIKAEKDKILSPNNTGRDQFIHAYCLLEDENYYELLAFLDALETHYDFRGVLISRIYALILKSIAALKIRDITKCIETFRSAYDLAHANSLIMPFIELGKYMRAVIYTVRQYDDCPIPESWLDEIYSKASTYAKRQAYFRAKNSADSTKKARQIELTKREKELLMNLIQGLTREEIAEALYISFSTVKSTLSGIYRKLGTVNKADAIRIAIQMGLDE